MNSKLDLIGTQLLKNPLLSENVVYQQESKSVDVTTFDFPQWINQELLLTLKGRKIEGLFSHQVEALDLINHTKDIVITTGTSSGKSLCYQIPILNQIYNNETSAALLFFPTKALTQDQLKAMRDLLPSRTAHENPFIVSVYDGDTPSSQRVEIRKKVNVLLTNPDMLNLGILPHHTAWASFFERIKYIVLDEIHLYRGVFGSHIANLIRRLNRILEFYGSRPQYIMASATIANPCELAQQLTNREILEVSQDGAPRGRKQFFIFNPPIVNQELGIREGVLSTASKLSSLLLLYEIQTLVFCQTRRFVELLLMEIKNLNFNKAKLIRGYRSGYLKNDRREIEEGLKNGEIRLAVATNALELGVDIGGVDAVLIAGYPGSICSLKQRIGRSGRSLNPSLSVFITSMNPLDQFFARNPDYLMGRPMERALINPDNPLILLPHIRSAIFELPMIEGQNFANLKWEFLDEYLDYLIDEGVIQKKNQKYFWLSDSYPSNDFSLRSTVARNVLIEYRTSESDDPVTIGEVDYESALWMVHPGAVYLQDGRDYLVDNLDLEHSIAILEDHTGDYVTEPVVTQEVIPTSILSEVENVYFTKKYGEIEVNSQVTAYKKIQNITKSVLSIETLDLPISRLETTGFWIEFNEECVRRMKDESLWLSTPNDYGKDWKKITETVRKRDNNRCQSCQKSEEGFSFHVHHRIPFKNFTSIERANDLENLVTLCPVCHRLAEMSIRIRSALSGLKYLMGHLAPLLVLCEASDIRTFADPNAKFADSKPVILIYDSIPAGIGLSRSLFDRLEEFLENCQIAVTGCDCLDGCPACVGPSAENGLGGKKESLYLIKILLEGLK